MKIGLSYSRCVRDIVEKKVSIDDVLVVISRTDFDPHNDKQWAGIWRGYTGGRFLTPSMEWGGYDVENAEHEALFRDVSIELLETGRLHQPRQFGAHPARSRYYWLETVLPDSELDSRPAVREAWDQFQLLAGLANVKMDREYS